LGILLMASPLSARAASIALSFTNSPSSVTVTNGTLVPVNVVAATGGAPVIVSATLNFRTWAPLCTNLWNSLPLATNASPTNFVATIPRLPAGNVDYYASCTYVNEDGSLTTTVASVTNTYTVGSVMGASRQEDFTDTWYNTSGTPTINTTALGVFLTNAVGWSVTNIFLPTIKGGAQQPSGNNTYCVLGNTTNSWLQTPLLSGGVGWVSFDAACVRSTWIVAQPFYVQTSLDGMTWTTVLTTNVSGSVAIHPQIVVSSNLPVYVRFFRNLYNSGDSGNDSGVVLDSIRITYPPADLQISLSTNPVTPPNPQAYQATTFRCNVQDISTNEPTINQRLTLFYTWVSTNGVLTNSSSLMLTNAAGVPGQYSGVLANLDAGTNSYYYRCDFDGYYYTNSDKRGPYYLSAAGQTSTNSVPTNTFQYGIVFQYVSTLQLGTNELDFGGVATNAAPGSRILTVANISGNVPLTVTNVDCAAPFALQTALPLTVPVGSISNLIITFAPSDTSVHTNLLTVYSDATAVSGTNIVLLTGTGLVAETTSMLSFTGPTNGPKNTLLTYAATATNNYNHALQYQFDWGDGTPVVWTNASVQSHAWTNAATYSVNARAVADAVVTSAWYALPTVTLTNTRAIRLVGNLPGLLDCGGVATGSVVSVPLLVCNDGVDTLTVTNITAPAPFGISSPTNFSVAMNGSTNVMVTFAPLATNVFTNTLTVWSDALSGTNTISLSGTGIVSEAISAPVLLGATSGQPTNSLSFWATAIDNYGSNIQYRFDWGNGFITGWGTTVASGTTYTNTYSWATPTTVLVRAQAQNPFNTNIISAWSLPLAVTIDYTRVLGLGSSNLAFGLAVTNTTASLSLAVTNSGTGPLTVSNVMGTPGFSATPTNFTLAAGAGTNITAMFTPALLQSYTGTITVVNNMTSGSNTVVVTGTGVTFNAVIGLSGPTSGIISNTLTPYTVTVTNTWTEPVAYMFGWGDGVTSAWQAASSTSHVWTTVGTNAVQARVQSTVHTNEISAWSSPLLVTIFGAPSVSFGTVTNGKPISVTVTIGALPGTVSNVVFWYLPPNSTGTNLVSMTLTNGSGVWQGTLPPLTAGNLSYYLQYAQAGTSLSYPSTGNYSLAITNYLGPVQQENFAGTWLTGTGTVVNGSNLTNAFNVYNTAGWIGTNVLVGTIKGGISTDPNLPTTTPLNYLALWNADTSYLQTPVLTNGIGTIYFEAVLKSSGSGWSATLAVQVSTNNGASFDQTVYSTTLSGTTVARPAITLNLRQASTMVRFVRTSGYNSNDGNQNNTAIILDNLIISPPPTDMTITESLHNPGYPNSKDPVYVRCQTADADPVNAPSVNRRLTVYYKYQTAPTWSSTNMYATGINTYEGIIPVYPQGTMSYYFKCDFDGFYYSNSIYAGTAQANLFKSENISPAYLPDQRTTNYVASFPVLTQYPVPVSSGSPSIPTYQINIFRSDASGMILLTTPNVGAPQNVMQLVDDNTWQGLINMQGITNLTWFFQGANTYTNNALSFGATTSWGDTNQDFIFPPLGGTADVSTNSPLQASLVYNGFLVFRFVTTNQNYLVKRAVFQDFNTWQADQNYFESSLGLYAITTFTNNFAAWGTNYFAVATTWAIEDFQSEALNTAYSSGEQVTHNWWAYREAAPIAERAFLPPNTLTPNQALQLNNASTAQGQVWNTSSAIPQGIHNFAFRARLSQNDGNYAYYEKDVVNLTNGSPWTCGYRVTNTVRAISMSPANPSLSLLLCYSRNTYQPDLGRFYELRVTQVSDTTIADSKMQMQLFRWNNGVANAVGAAATVQSQRLTDASPLQFDISWTNVGATIQFTGSVSRAGSTPFALTILTTDNSPLQVPNTSPALYGGTVGFLCADAEAEVWGMNVFCGTNLSSGFLIPMVNWNAASLNPYSWYFGGTRSDGQNWWQTNYAGSVAGYLTRPIPPVSPRLALSDIRTGTSGVRDPDLTTYTNVASFGISSYSYTNLTQSFNVWDQTYVMLQYTNGDLPIVVDDLTLDPWRAYTRGFADSNWNNEATVSGVQFWDWTSTAQQYTWSQNGKLDENGWLIFEGLVANSAAAGNYASFDLSRADPNLDQGLWSPILTNGIGSLAFQVTVASGTSVYRVEYTSTAGSTASWSALQTFTNTVADGPVNNFVPVQQAHETGRIRVVQLPSLLSASNTWIGGSSPGAILNIDNLVAVDYPPPDVTTWTAYNCLIARPSTNNFTLDPVNISNSRAYEPTVFDHQSCYLNNSPTVGVLTPQILSADNPYVQTPQVDTGIGEIAFWYRAWDTNTAYVSIRVAPNASVPVGQWTVITNFAVTNLTYQYFDLSTVFDTDDQVMRIYTQTNSVLTNNAGRLCIDNVLMTEPVRAGYQITGVTLLPNQPLMTDQVGVQATIGNFLMAPQGIQLYLSYYKGTNIWGYANWRGRDTNVLNTCTTIPMNLTSPGGNTYSTPVGSNIPTNAIDDVVQFVVWGSFSNMVGRPVFQGTNTFVNPSWYYPIDLNPTNAAGAYITPTNWSPYYFVFSCPPGSVWINEFNYVVLVNEYGGEYVELCGHANTDISKWKIDVIDPLNNFSLYDEAVVPAATKMQEWYSPVDGTLQTDGWGFWVWGGSLVYLPGPLASFWDGSEYLYYTTTLPPNLQGNDSQQTLLLQNAGLRLVRSMGAYEERICYGPSAINDELVAQGYTYLGAKHTDPPWNAPLALQGDGTNAAEFYWYQPSTNPNNPYGTPGYPNVDQTITPLASSYFTLVSAIGPHGAQNIGNPPTSPLVTVQIAAGSSTTIVYTADSWCRIASLTSNNSSVPAATGTQYIWTVSNVSQDISNNATFYLLPDNQNGQNVPTSWLTNFGQSETAPFGGGLSVSNAYALNMNPYLSNAVTLAMNAIAATSSTVNVAVQLLESTNGSAYAPQQSINGTLVVDATTNLVSANWTPVASTQMPPPSVIFDTNGVAAFALPALDTNKFYRARIQ
jgi:hypothetical protein